MAVHLTTKNTKESENDAFEAIFPGCRSTSTAQPITRIEVFVSSNFVLFVVVLISFACHQPTE